MSIMSKKTQNYTFLYGFVGIMHTTLNSKYQ